MRILGERVIFVHTIKMGGAIQVGRYSIGKNVYFVKVGRPRGPMLIMGNYYSIRDFACAPSIKIKF